MINKNVSVSKVNITSCNCCNHVSDIVTQEKEAFLKKFREDHPNSKLDNYDIRLKVLGVPGYEIKGNYYNEVSFCEPCMDAMLRASQVLQANKLQSASVTTDLKYKYKIQYDSFTAEELANEEVF